MSDQRPIRIGVSSCLLGEQVRFDGGHKRDNFLVNVFGPYVEWVPVCPEVEIGLGTPRETIRLERKAGLVHLIAPKSQTDHTKTMRAWSRRRLKELAREDLSGYVLKSKSPSCGMERVPLYDENGGRAKQGRGLFAEALLEQFGNLPVEEEGRLNDPVLRENFIERVFAYHRLQGVFRASAGGRAMPSIPHRPQIPADGPLAETLSLARPAGRRSQNHPAQRSFASQYESGFMEAMRLHATNGKHANVLEHMAGIRERLLDAGARQELRGIIEDYRNHLVPLIVPLTLIRHHVRQHKVAYLEGQLYLQPHPKELMLRNHV